MKPDLSQFQEISANIFFGVKVVFAAKYWIVKPAIPLTSAVKM